MAWYRAGTVNVTNNSSAVIGVGTAWIRSASIGEGFKGPDGVIYEITGISSDTSLTIYPAYKGPTSTVQSYEIVPTQSYMRDLAAAAAELVGRYASVADSAGQGKFAAGTADTPSLRGVADQDTGINFPGNDVLELLSGGVVKALVRPEGLTDPGLNKFLTAASAVGSLGSGAIIERGSNSTGSWTRFADGTQIATLDRNFSGTWPAGQAFNARPAWPEFHAAAFVDEPVMISTADMWNDELPLYVQSNFAMGDHIFVNTGHTPLSTHPPVGVGPGGHAADRVQIKGILIGRWK